MEIKIDEDWLKILYEILFDFYRNSGHPITAGYSEGMISVCVNRPQVWIRNFIPYPHLLHKATVLMHSIINFHPFVDGNKRIALLATTFYLHWNGYDFEIPKDADNFTIDIAKGKYSLNDILNWLLRNSRRTPSSVLNHLLCRNIMKLGEDLPPSSSEFLALLAVVFFMPTSALDFFREKRGSEHKLPI